MAPLALACAFIPPESATAVENASDYGTSARRGSHVVATAAASTSTRHLSGSKEYGSQKSLGAGSGSGSGSGLGSGQDESDRSARLAASVPSAASSAAGPSRGHLDLCSRRRQADTGKHRGGSRSERLEERSGGGVSPSTSSPLLGVWGSEEGRAGGDAGEDEETPVDWQKHTAEIGNGSGACLVMSPSGVASRGSEGQEDESAAAAAAVAAGWAVGEPAVASLGSLNSGGPVLAVASGPFDERLAADTVESVLARDVLKIADRCVFCLVVLGGSAVAAVSAGMSTFGTGFVTSLEFLSSETAAAATFGGVICAAGLAGTPAGGALIDSADPEGRLGDDEKLALVLRQASALMCGATGERGMT